eukprot:XP_016866974.1 WD repeat-containing protein 46 isoform X2 [Homo sapiens]
MSQNPYNAVIHLGHSNGTVSLWSPAMKEPLAKILCHRGGVRAVAVDSTGTYMATSGLDHQLKIFDLRGTYQPLSTRTLPHGAGHLAFSQRGLLVAGMGDVVNIWAGQGKASPPSLEQPYLTHRLSGPVHGLQFCPFEDVLGVGHTGGITSMLVPGAGEPNFDGLESNPYRSRKQRQEWEVKALLEKVPAELICLDPRALAEVDVISLEQGKKEQIERLGYDPQAKAPFQPKPKQKGRSSTASLVKRKRKVMDEEHRVNEHWHGPGLPQAAPSCLCLCPCQPATSHSVPVSSPSPVPRTRSGRAFSSSIIRRRRPSPRGPGHLPWTDLCAEPDSRVAWEQSLPKITCREMSVPWNKEVGAVWPLPQLGVDSCLLGWVGIKEESDFLDNVSGSSCGPVPLPLAKHEAILGSEGSVSCLYPHPIPCGCCGLSFAF